MVLNLRGGGGRVSVAVYDDKIWIWNFFILFLFSCLVIFFSLVLICLV